MGEKFALSHFNYFVVETGQMSFAPTFEKFYAKNSPDRIFKHIKNHLSKKRYFNGTRRMLDLRLR
jgi:hypothetical protein